VRLVLPQDPGASRGSRYACSRAPRADRFTPVGAVMVGRPERLLMERIYPGSQYSTEAELLREPRMWWSVRSRMFFILDNVVTLCIACFS
jgi:hypothetical protein